MAHLQTSGLVWTRGLAGPLASTSTSRCLRAGKPLQDLSPSLSLSGPGVMLVLVSSQRTDTSGQPGGTWIVICLSQHDNRQGQGRVRQMASCHK